MSLSQPCKFDANAYAFAAQHKHAKAGSELCTFDVVTRR